MVIRCLLVVVFLISSIFAQYQPSDSLIKEMRHYQRVYEANPTSNQACFDLAMVYAYTGAVEEGFEKLKRLDKSYADEVLLRMAENIKENPTEWRYYFKIAFAYYFKEDYDASISCFKQVLERDPNNIWAMAFIAYVSGEQGRLDVAFDWVKKALEIEPDAAACHFLLGEIYRRKGKYIKAASHFMKCMHNRTLERGFRSSL